MNDPNYPCLLRRAWICLVAKRKEARVAAAASTLACHAWNTGDDALFEQMHALQEKLWDAIYTKTTTKIQHRFNELVRRLSAWAWHDELKLQQNVIEDAQALVDALLRGEQADAYCGYGRDGQASNYRDELKCSLRDLKRNK